MGSPGAQIQGDSKISCKAVSQRASAVNVRPSYSYSVQLSRLLRLGQDMDKVNVALDSILDIHIQ